MLAAVRPAGGIPVPGRARRADLLDAAFLGGTAAHGIELDDGFRQGSVHPGCVVVPAVLALGYDRRISGKALIEAVVAGYEAEIAIGRACPSRPAPARIPSDRRRRRVRRGDGGRQAARAFGHQLANALGIAASSAAGLFAFVNGGADIKRLHAGHASREGLQAALLAEQGIEGPPDVIEARDGFMQAFAFGRADKARADRAAAGRAVRHHRLLHQALSVLPAHPAGGRGVDRSARTTRRSRPTRSQRIDVATYRIAAEHAEYRLGRFRQRPAQLSLSDGRVALKFRGIKFEHFNEAKRRDPAFNAFARKLNVTAPPRSTGSIRNLRPARVTVTTARGQFTRQADEALGSRIVPLDDAGLKAKFLGLVGPVLGTAKAKELDERIWSIEEIGDVAPLVESMAK